VRPQRSWRVSRSSGQHLPCLSERRDPPYRQQRNVPDGLWRAFAAATKQAIADADLGLRHLTATFPPTCSRCIVSTRPDVRGELAHDEGGSIVPELCAWYISRPSLVRFTIRSRSRSRLIITAVDGEAVPKELAEGTLDVEIRSDILFR
jgi:hypothetical protein